MYIRKQAHKMVEEFMILANEFVAKKLCRSFGGDSLVIHHPPPSELNQQYFNKFFQDYNIKVHFKNMRELQLQIKELIDKGLKKEIEELLILKASRSQELASYALNKNNADTKEHFALNLESYTHFTSPMRRFADIIAH
jgi:ribonuclease R